MTKALTHDEKFEQFCLDTYGRELSPEEKEQVRSFWETRKRLNSDDRKR